MYSDLTPIFPAGSSSRPIALITGASRGIGKAIAETFAQAGYDLILTCRQNREKLETLCKSLSEAYSIQAAAFIGDLGDYETVRELFAPIRRLNLLVNNAGITKDNLLMKMKEEEFDAVIDTNLKGSFNTMRHIARYMLKQKSGSIVNISSVSGILGNPGQMNYCASKAGVIGMTKTAAKELAARGITVNAIAPGFIETDMTGKLSEKIREQMSAQIPLGHFGKPEHVAKAAAFLASDDAAYITGQVLNVDGGMVM